MTSGPDRLQRWQAAIPVLLQFAGLFGFVAAQVLWLGFSRPEPEFMGICLTVAAGGYISQGLLGLKGAGPPPTPTRETEVPPSPAPEETG